MQVCSLPCIERVNSSFLCLHFWSAVARIWSVRTSWTLYLSLCLISIIACFEHKQLVLQSNPTDDLNVLLFFIVTSVELIFRRFSSVKSLLHIWWTQDWKETYTFLSNFYHNKLNISRILKADKLFGIQYLQRIKVIVNESIVTSFMCS